MLRGGERMKKIALMLICMLVVPVLASADLTIEEKTSVRGFMGIWGSEGTEVTYIKGDMMRSESDTQKMGMGSHRGMENPPPAVTIIRMDKGLIWYVNTLDKTYMESPFEPLPETDEENAPGFGVVDVTVEETSETKEVMGKTCDGVKAAITFETQGSEGLVSETVDVMFWMNSEVKSLAEMREFWENMVEMSQSQKQKVPMGDVMEQLWEKVGKDGKVPLAMDMSVTSSSLDPDEEAQMKEAAEAMNSMMAGREGEEAAGGEDDMAMHMSREIVSISDDKLPDSLFEVPKDYRKAKAIRMW
jgi:hypothetical protein